MSPRETRPAPWRAMVPATILIVLVLALAVTAAVTTSRLHDESSMRLRHLGLARSAIQHLTAASAEDQKLQAREAQRWTSPSASDALRKIIAHHLRAGLSQFRELAATRSGAEIAIIRHMVDETEEYAEALRRESAATARGDVGAANRVSSDQVNPLFEDLDRDFDKLVASLNAVVRERSDRATLGSWIVIGAAFLLVGGGAVGGGFELRRRLRSDLSRRADRRLHTLIANAPDLVLILDDSFTINYVSPNIERVLGRTVDCRASSVFSLLEPIDSDAARAAAVIAELREDGEQARFLGHAHHGDGSRRVIASVVTRLIDDPAIKGFVVNARDVTEEQKLQSDLDAAVDELQLVLDSAPDGLAILDVNTFAMRLLNRPDLLGHNPDSITGMLSLEELVDPQDVPEVATWWFSEVTVPGAVGNLDHEMRLRRADGVYIWVNVRLSPLTFDGDGVPMTLLSAITDVDDRHRVEAALADSERQLRAVVETSPDVVAFLDLADLTLDFVNATEFLGFPVERLHNLGEQGAPEFVHPDDLASLEAFTRLPIDATTGEGVEFRSRNADGDWTWVRLRHSVATTDADGTPTRWLLTMTLIEDEIEARAQSDRLRSQLEQAQRLQAVGQLAGGVAHDFNNLLSAILGFAELLEDSVSTDSVALDDLREIKDAAGRGADLSRKLLTFSRGEARETGAVNLADALRGMHRLFARIIGESIELELRIEDSPPVVGDSTGVEQILMNLVVNARDAIDGRGTISVTSESRRLDEADCAALVHGSLTPGDYVIVAVTDDGVGMDTATAQRAFEPFFTTKPLDRGTGLGLATVYGIVHRFGGHVSIDSAVGEGTTVRIYFLVASSDLPAPTVTPAVPAALTSRGDTAAGVDILLVEDERAVRTAICRILERTGHRVTIAADGAAAIRVARTRHFDVLLTDVVMPGGMNGRATADAIRALRGCDHVIYISGYSPEAVANNGVLEEGVMLLEKPVTADRLLSAIDHAMSCPPPEDYESTGNTSSGLLASVATSE